MTKIKKLAYSVLTSIFIISGCTKSIPYKIEIDQGHTITSNDISMLSVGMTKDDVVLAIGRPLLNDPFNINRWDYIQYYKNAKTQKVQQGRVSLIFKNDLLITINESKLVSIKTEKLTY